MVTKSTAEPNERTTKCVISLLFYILGLSCWITVIGVFSELSLMQSHITEGYEIWSWLALIIQLGAIGPLIYSLIPQTYKSQTFIITSGYFIFLFSFISMIIMILYWDFQVYIFGENRSLILYITIFITSICSTMTCIIFFIFVSYFHTKYISTFSSGISSAGIVCAVLLYIQQLNRQDNNPRFSIEIYFLCISLILPISCIAYFILHKYLKNHIKTTTDETEKTSQSTVVKTDKNTQEINNTIQDSYSIYIYPYWLYIFIMTILNFVQNGMIPALLSYVLLPYGQNVYIYSYTMSNIFPPIACLLPGYFTKMLVTKTFIILSSLGWFIAAIYIILIWLYHPFGIQNDSSKLFFAIVIILVTVFGECLLDICKTCIYCFIKQSFVTKTENMDSETAQKILSHIMEIIGRSTHVGSFCGALIFFIFINVNIYVGIIVFVLMVLLMVSFVFMVMCKHNEEMNAMETVDSASTTITLSSIIMTEISENKAENCSETNVTNPNSNQ